MPGQPLKRACLAALDEHEEEIFDRLASGEFVTTLCRDYLAEPYREAGKDDRSNNYHFYNWLDEADGRRERFNRVRESAADAVAEESVKLLDDLHEKGVESTAEATLAKARSHSRQWWASKLSAKYADGRQEVDVNVNLGQLHLDALRKAGHMHRGELEAIEGEWEEADHSLPERKRLGEIPDG